MRPRMLRRSATACLGVFAGLVAATMTSDAQTWHWSYVTRTPNAPPLAAQSTVAVGAGELRMSYTVPIAHRQVVIESCHAPLADIASAAMARTQGHIYLLVALKPSHDASCASGKRPAIALPTDNEKYVSGIVDAINRLCCSATVAREATPKASPEPTLEPKTPQPKPTVTPTPKPQASSPAPKVATLPSSAETENLTGTSLPARLIKRGSSRLAIGETGTALMRVTIGPSGTPQEVTIVSISNRRLSAAAIETAVSSTYAPATLHGKPVAAKYIATFSFDGEDPALSAIPAWKRPLPVASGAPTSAPDATSTAPVQTPGATATAAPTPAPDPTPAQMASPMESPSGAEPPASMTPVPITPVPITPAPAPSPQSSAPEPIPSAAPTPSATSSPLR